MNVVLITEDVSRSVLTLSVATTALVVLDTCWTAIVAIVLVRKIIMLCWVGLWRRAIVVVVCVCVCVC